MLVAEDERAWTVCTNGVVTRTSSKITLAINALVCASMQMPHLCKHVDQCRYC